MGEETGPNQLWGDDFVFDSYATGQTLKRLTVIDEWTRVSLAIDMAASTGADLACVSRHLEAGEDGRVWNFGSTGPRRTSPCGAESWARRRSTGTAISATSRTSSDVGTGGRFQVPSLLGGAWRASFLHDGRATTLTARFAIGGGDEHGITSGLSAAQVADLVAYLETL